MQRERDITIVHHVADAEVQQAAIRAGMVRPPVLPVQVSDEAVALHGLQDGVFSTLRQLSPFPPMPSQEAIPPREV